MLAKHPSGFGLLPDLDVFYNKILMRRSRYNVASKQSTFQLMQKCAAAAGGKIGKITYAPAVLLTAYLLASLIYQ
jgi:hypothetical protein